MNEATQGEATQGEAASERRRPSALPELGASVRGWMLLAAFAVASAGACLVTLTNLGWLIIGLVLTALALIFRRLMLPWLLILLLGASVFWQLPDPANWRFYLVLAGLHVIHLLGGLLAWIPPTSHVQLAVFAPMARRFLLIQVPVQVLSWLALVIWSGHSGAAPAFGVLAGIALALLAVVLALPMFRRE